LAERPGSDLGSIGGGNHFAEIKCVQKIFGQDKAQKYINKAAAFLLVYSGSRYCGSGIFAAANAV
jgi:RNA-splicing ligase RtcB